MVRGGLVTREEQAQDLIAQRAVVELVALRAAAVDEQLDEAGACEVPAALGREVGVDTDVDVADGVGEALGPAVAAAA